MEQKHLQTTTFLHGRSAGDNQQQYRPRESPANHYIHGGAGDAGGILLDVVILHALGW
jgi:hypothetical protein